MAAAVDVIAVLVNGATEPFDIPAAVTGCGVTASAGKAAVVAAVATPVETLAATAAAVPCRKAQKRKELEKYVAIKVGIRWTLYLCSTSSWANLEHYAAAL